MNNPADVRVSLNDGSSIPQLGLGLFEVEPEQTTEIVLEALRAGYRHIDTASLYRNEAGVGRAIAESGIDRLELFVTTKMWNSQQGPDRTRKALERSLERLGLEVLDLYLIHWPAPTQDLYLETWQTLIELREEGRVRSIGVSNFLPQHLERIIGETGVVPAVNQIEVHPLFTQNGLRAVNAGYGIATESWSPLARGRLLDDLVLAGIAARLERTPAQVVLRWHLQNGLISIPRSTSPLRLRENAAIFDWELAEDDMRAIDGLNVDGRIGTHPDERD